MVDDPVCRLQSLVDFQRITQIHGDVHIAQLHPIARGQHCHLWTGGAEDQHSRGHGNDVCAHRYRQMHFSVVARQQFGAGIGDLELRQQ